MAPKLMSGNRYLGIKVSGSSMSRETNDGVTELDFTLSTSAVSSIKMTVLDDYLLRIFNQMRTGRTLTYAGYSFRITTRSTDSSDGGAVVKVEAISKRADKLQRDIGEKSWGNMDVGQWVKKVGGWGGFKVKVQPGLGTREMLRSAPDGASAQSSWDILSSLKSELGVWMFEYGDKLWFGKPSWIVKQSGRGNWKFTWNNLRDHTASLVALPKYRETPDSREPDKREAMTLLYVSPYATQVRPGDTVQMSSRGKYKFEGKWLVASVNGAGTSATSPVSIECVRAVNPIPRPPKVKESADGGGEFGGASTKGVFDVTPTGPIGGYAQHQINNARRIVNAALAMRLSIKAQYIGVMVAMGESSLMNVNRGDAVGPDSRGLFQQRANGAWGSLSDRMNPEIAATNFFKAMLKVSGWQSKTPTQVAHETQRNADPNHYTKYYKTAKKIVDALHDSNRSIGAKYGEMENYKGGIPTTGVDTSSIDPSFFREFQAFRSKYKGRRYDYDGNYGAQCVDLLKAYCDELFGLKNVRGNGRDYWNNSALTGKFIRISKNSVPRYGDIACYSNTGYGLGIKYGHVDIIISSNGDRNYTFGQLNGLTGHYHMKKTGLQGYLRPRRATNRSITSGRTGNTAV